MNAGSLFTGIGGLDLGVGVPPAWFCEADKHCRTVLERHWPGVPVYPDVREVGADAPRVDVLHGGYPCQPFSSAGKRGGKEDPRHLWPQFARLISLLRPPCAVLENVAGHLTLGFDSVIGGLAEMGYDAQWGVVRASDVGAPHARARLFVVAWDSQLSREDALAPLRRSRNPTGESGGAAADARSERLNGLGSEGSEGSEGSWRPSVARSGTPAPDANGESRESGLGRRTPCGHHTRSDTEERYGDRHDGPTEHGSTLQALADADEGSGLGRLQPSVGPRSDALGRSEDRDDGDSSTDWGVYSIAIRRWETVAGPAPRPTDDRGRLMPEFVEWMMGFPAGWVDGIGRTHALRMLGNAVVPQQAALALSLLSQGAK